MGDFSVALFSDPPEMTWVWPELARSGIKLACAVSLSPRILRNDLLDKLRQEADQRGIPFFRVEDLSSPEFQAAFFKTKPSVIATVTLLRKIPSSILKQVPLGGINYHPALLPRYRGASPCFWPIYNGDSETGVSIHEMTDQFDAGDIHFRKKISIDSDETSGSLAIKCLKEGVKLILMALKELEQGRKLPRIPQDSSQATRAPYPTLDILEIKWNQPAQKIAALIRAASPFYGAFTTFRDQRLVIWSAQFSRENAEHLSPGTLIVSRGKTEVAASDAMISLETIQHVFMRFYSGAEFLRIPRIKDGIILGTPGKEDSASP